MLYQLFDVGFVVIVQREKLVLMPQFFGEKFYFCGQRGDLCFEHIVFYVYHIFLSLNNCCGFFSFHEAFGGDHSFGIGEDVIE